MRLLDSDSVGLDERSWVKLWQASTTEDVQHVRLRNLVTVPQGIAACVLQLQLQAESTIVWPYLGSGSSPAKHLWHNLTGARANDEALCDLKRRVHCR